MEHIKQSLQVLLVDILRRFCASEDFSTIWRLYSLSSIEWEKVLISVEDFIEHNFCLIQHNQFIQMVCYSLIMDIATKKW